MLRARSLAWLLNARLRDDADGIGGIDRIAERSA